MSDSIAYPTSTYLEYKLKKVKRAQANTAKLDLSAILTDETK